MIGDIIYRLEWLYTLVVEKENLGGVCLNWGCIPTKALLKSAQVFEYINHANDYGITGFCFANGKHVVRGDSKKNIKFHALFARSSWS